VDSIRVLATVLRLSHEGSVFETHPSWVYHRKLPVNLGVSFYGAALTSYRGCPKSKACHMLGACRRQSQIKKKPKDVYIFEMYTYLKALF
jgi:hypothetical protein